MGRLGIWASPSPGTAAPLPPAQAGLPGSLARCQVRRPCGQQGGASGGSAEDVAGRPGLKQHPSREARGQKVRAPPWVRGGCRAGGRQRGRLGRPAGGERLGGSGTKQVSARPGCYLPAGLLPPSLWATQLRGEAGGRAWGPAGAQTPSRGRGRAEEGPARRGPGLSRRKTSQGLQIAALSFFFNSSCLGGKKSSASSGGGRKKDAEF